MDELQSISTIKQIPSKLFHPYRLLILIDLKLSGVLRFNKIRDDVGLSDGNLAGHLRALEQEGYIKTNTILEKRRLKSCIEITQEGLKVLSEFSEQLKGVMKILSRT